MLSFRRLDVIIASPGAPPDGNANVILCWELVTQHSGLDVTTFTIERSLTHQFDDIQTVAEDIPAAPGQLVYTFNDITPNLFNFWRNYFYRIKATTAEGTIYSDVRTWESLPRPHEMEMIARHDFVLRYCQGVPTFVFVERTAESAPCTCFDLTAGRSRVSDCTLCLGTGRQRPFFDPILTYIDYNPARKDTQITGMGEVQNNRKASWCSAYPLLKPADIFYAVGTGILWRIERIEPVEIAHVTIQQVAHLSAIGRDEVEYQRLPQQIPEATLLSVVQEWERIKEERMF
jgi:hypothetical protein